MLVIMRLAHTGRAWRDDPSWRVSPERRLWSLEMHKVKTGGGIGRSVSFIIPAWAGKHAATDHTSTRDYEVKGWLAGFDKDGPIVVDADGVIWSGLGEIELSYRKEQLTAETQRSQR